MAKRPWKTLHPRKRRPRLAASAGPWLAAAASLAPFGRHRPFVKSLGSDRKRRRSGARGWRDDALAGADAAAIAASYSVKCTLSM
jgi:hypothetical protein